ncbi:MAG: hypothetical protein JRI68_31470, partial [Deltaproteobacteria bacterium]|nr:hypothetical protein [Deltaproteobacteria bacterium]
HTSPRDFARIGWFWLNHGRWGDQQLLAANLLAEHLTPAVPGSLPRTAGGNTNDYLGIGTYGGGTDQTGLGPGIYGFNWWFNPGSQVWPAAPADTVQANGHWNGEVLTFIPSLAIVAAWRGSGANPESFNDPMNAILTALMDTVLP